MKLSKRILAWVLSVALLLTCLPSVLLPVSAATELLGAAGTFDDPSIDYTAGIFTTILNSSGASIAIDPDDANNKVLKYTGGSKYLNLFGYVSNGTAYKFTCRMKGEDGVGNVTAGTKRLNKHTVATNGDTAEDVLVPVTEEWQTLTRYVLPGDTASYNTNYVIGVQSKNAAVYFDDFTLTPLDVTEITLDETFTLGGGKSAPLPFTLGPKGAQYLSVSWESSDDAVVSVDQNGTITANAAAGTADITLTVATSSGNVSKTCTVTVESLADTIALSHSTLYFSTPTGNTNMSKTLRVLPEPATAFPGNLTWKSSDDTVASVDQNGKVTALAEGTAVITLESDLGLEATCTVTVDPYGEKLIGGDFEAQDYAIELWQKNLLNVASGKGTVEPEEGNEQNHVLRIPTGVDSSKYIYGVPCQVGRTYCISLRAKGNTTLSTYIHSEYTVAGDRGHNEVKLNADEWTSLCYFFTTNSDSINPRYLIGFSNEGSGDVFIDDCSIIEMPKATALTVTPAKAELFPGRKLTLTVGTVPASASAGVMTWSGDNDDVAVIDANGVVTAMDKTGTVTFTGVNPDGLTVTATVTVSEYANLFVNGDFEAGGTSWDSGATFGNTGKNGTGGMSIAPKSNGSKRDIFYKGSLPLLPATRYELTFDYYLNDDSAFRIWSGNIGCSMYPSYDVRGEWVSARCEFTTPADLALSTNWDIAFVAEAGVTVIDNARLRMYSTGVAAESIQMQPEQIKVAVGYSTVLSLLATPDNADLNHTTWVSDNADVVKVQNGKITAVSKGTATITATNNGKTASCVVTVVKPTSISLEENAVTLKLSEQKTLAYSAFLNSSLANDIAWSSSDAAVVTVQDGVLTPVGVGTATVTAAVTNRVYAYCVVTVLPSVDAPVYSAVTVDPVENGSVTVSATSAESGSMVTVSVVPNQGYQTVPGSLKYITTDGTEHRILNKAEGGFGQGDGTQFAFIMPVGAVRVSAEFTPAKDNEFSAASVGSSLFYEKNAADPTGIRFLTRMHVNNLQLQGGTFTLTYNDVTYTVREFGTLLKRSLNPAALVIENYNAADSVGATRLWKSVAYDGNTMRLVDYTDSYLDYTVVMKTSAGSEAFNARYYDTRAYAVLDDGTEAGLTIYSDVFTDSPADAMQRIDNRGSMAVVLADDVQVNSPSNNITVDPLTEDVREYLGLSADDQLAAEFWCASHGDNDTMTPILLEWEEDGSDYYRVMWSTDPSFDKADSVITGNCFYTLQRLIPGNTYYWKVRNARGMESEVRTFDLMEGPRWIDADGGRNIRDLGGWETADGQTVNYGLLYRGACIDGYNGIELTEEGVRIFREELGIVTEIDLRGGDDGDSGAQTESDCDAVYVKAVLNQYDKIFTTASSKTSLGKIMDVLSKEENYPIYFHCNAGADRTGTLAFIINGLLGVSPEDLTADFEMTGFGVGNRLRSALDTTSGTFDDSGIMQSNSSNYIAWGPLCEKMMTDFGVEGGTLADAIENFLISECGVTADEIAALRRIMLG